jgi:hypothetical protein
VDLQVAKRVEAFANGWDDRVIAVRWYTDRCNPEAVVAQGRHHTAE